MFRRHNGMDHGDGHDDMAMGSMTSMVMSGMASMTDMMASATATSGGHDHASMTMDMGSSSTSGSGSMMHMEMDSMHMYFTTQFKDYPVLFKGLAASNKGQAFGIFVLLFVVAFLARSFDFFRNYLEFKVWHNPAYYDLPQNNFRNMANKNECCDVKDSDTNETSLEPVNAKGLSASSSIFRDIIRLALSIIPEILSYALMLAAMSYTLTYFFAVCLGSGIGRFVFDKLSYRMGIRPSAAAAHC